MYSDSAQCDSVSPLPPVAIERFGAATTYSKGATALLRHRGAFRRQPALNIFQNRRGRRLPGLSKAPDVARRRPGHVELHEPVLAPERPRATHDESITAFALTRLAAGRPVLCDLGTYGPVDRRLGDPRPLLMEPPAPKTPLSYALPQGRTHARTDRHTDGRTDGRTDGQTDGRTNGCTHARTHARIVRAPVRTYVRPCVHARVGASVHVRGLCMDALLAAESRWRAAEV